MNAQIENQNENQNTLFVKLQALFEIIDEAKFDERVINEGEYLTLCRLIKEMRELRRDVITNTVYIQAVAVAGPPPVVERVVRQKRASPLSEIARSQHKDYICCNKCDRFVMKWGLADHQKRAVCVQAHQAKMSSMLKQKIHHSIFSKHQIFSRFFEIEFRGNTRVSFLPAVFQLALQVPLALRQQLPGQEVVPLLRDLCYRTDESGGVYDRTRLPGGGLHWRRRGQREEKMDNSETSVMNTSGLWIRSRDKYPVASGWTDCELEGFAPAIVSCAVVSCAGGGGGVSCDQEDDDTPIAQLIARKATEPRKKGVKKSAVAVSCAGGGGPPTAPHIKHTSIVLCEWCGDAIQTKSGYDVKLCVSCCIISKQ